MNLARELAAHLPLPETATARATELLIACRFHTTSFGGGGFAMTKDEAVRDELLEGWEVGRDDEGEAIYARCGQRGTFQYAPGGETYWELGLPPALVAISRELHDAKEATDG